MSWELYQKNFPELDGRLPLMLFPVRLETRFFPIGGATPSSLWVRIYPEPLSVDRWQPALTEGEEAAGKTYWSSILAALKAQSSKEYRRSGLNQMLRRLMEESCNPGDQQLSAWDRLVAATDGPRRALAILSSLWPTNLPLGADVRTPQELSFPTITRRNSDEDTIPRAPLLPEKWVVVVRSRDREMFRVISKEVTQGLPCGPSLSLAAQKKAATPERMLKEAGALWMVDLKEAEGCGMAVEIDLGPATALKTAEIQGGLSVYVWGIHTRRDPAASATELEQLLLRQHYTDGLSFVAPGTATNLLSGGSASRENPKPTDILPLPARSSGGDASGLGTKGSLYYKVGDLPGVLGFSKNSFLSGIPGSGSSREEGSAPDPEEAGKPTVQAALNRLCWHAALGLWMQDLSQWGMTSADRASAVESFYKNWVRSDGPFPTLKIGKQPYGLLPVIAADFSDRPRGTPDDWIQSLLLQARADRQRRATSVARIDPTVQDSSTDAAATSGQLHQVLQGSPDILACSEVDSWNESYFGWWGPDISFFDQVRNVETWVEASRKEIEDFLDPILTAVRAAAAAPTFTEQLQKVNALAPMLAERQAAHKKKIAEAPAAVATGKMSSASFKLLQLRAAWLIDGYAPSSGFPSRTPHLEQSIGRLVTLVQKNAMQLLVGGFVNAVTADVTEQAIVGSDPASVLRGEGDAVCLLRRVVDAATSGSNEAHWMSTDMKNALATERAQLALDKNLLAGLNKTELRRMFLSTLGLTAHRVDAWLTARASKQLLGNRVACTSGLAVGAYGWVNSLRPSPNPASQGYLLTASVEQATTAALLRSGYAVHGEATEQSPLNVDLSSARLRRARWLLDGLRQGQSLSALLGEWLERRLREEGMAELIAPLRKLSNNVTPTTDSKNAPALRIDGLVLARAVDPAAEDAELDKDSQELRTALIKAGYGSTSSGSSRPASWPHARESWQKWRQVTVDLVDYLDAVADAGVAESMKALAGGDFSRLGATAAALDRGEQPPPELSLSRPPSGGSRVQHRILLLLPPASGTLSSLELGLRRVLGEPSAFRLSLTCQGQRWSGTLADLGVDLVSLIRLAPAKLRGSPLEECLVRSAMARLFPLPATATPAARAEAEAKVAVVLEQEPPALSWEGWEELALLLAPLRGLLRNARPAQPADLEALGERAVDPDRHPGWAAAWKDPALPLDCPSQKLPEGFHNNRSQSAKRVGGGGEATLRGWLMGLAKVRTGASDLWDTMGLAEALSGRAIFAGQALQWGDPVGSTEAWAGAQLPAGDRASAVLFSLTPLAPVKEVATDSASILVIDSWVETVPSGLPGSNGEERGGLLLHWNAPGARAPQVIVLGVTNSKTWTAAGAEAIVSEVMAQTKVRAVLPALVDAESARLLPNDEDWRLLFPLPRYKLPPEKP